ncbi:MAG TPA: hypothetical protein VNF75_02880 [Candidatus Dormibacteraeota bacterium]|nr:hypothetical protein [Candidatus Dormibacteraeota bacterium]
MNHWARAAADLLQTRPIIPDIDREILAAAQRQSYPDFLAACGEFAAEAWGLDQEAAVQWAIAQGPSVNPQGWPDDPGDPLERRALALAALRTDTPLELADIVTLRPR